MVTTGSNKVLTVSYGTFSCTLEGFDDSFGMMKEIAEYFRDLAEQDRFFGSEPPKLDAEMLAILAKRSNQQGIAARTEGSTLVLSPSAQQAPRPVAPRPTATPAPTSTTLEERLQKIRNVVTGGAAATPSIADALAQTDDAEPMDQEVMDASLAQPKPVIDQPQNDLSPYETGADEFILRPAERVDPLVTEDVSLEEAKAEKEAADKAEAEAKAKAEKEAAEKAEAEAKAKAEKEAAEKAEAEAKAKAEKEAAEKAEAEAKAKAEKEAAEKAEAEAKAKAEKEAAEKAEAEAKAKAEKEAAEKAEAEAKAKAEKEAAEKAEAEAKAKAEKEATEKAEAEAKAKAEKEAAEKAEAEAKAKAEKEAAEKAEADARPGRVHVIDLREKNVPKAEDSDSFEDELSKALALDDEATTLAVTSTEDQTDPADDTEFEDDLAQALGQEDDTATPSQQQPVAPTRPQRPTVTSRRDTSNDQSTETVERLMDKADQHLSEPDNSRRRNALAHLRAAVAATMADKSLVKDKSSDSADAYRNDLAQAVRPTRPTRSAPTERAAPLRLVAEQRVDVDAVAPSTVPTPTFESFEQYVDYVGAHSLEAKLEAAASYLAQVQGIEAFTRPQIIRTIMACEGENFQREESLQSFARMIRDGKIVRSGNGFFEITDDIGYSIKDRQAG